jgi:ribosomal protein L34E
MRTDESVVPHDRRKEIEKKIKENEEALQDIKEQRPRELRPGEAKWKMTVRINGVPS